MYEYRDILPEIAAGTRYDNLPDGRYEYPEIREQTDAEADAWYPREDASVEVREQTEEEADLYTRQIYIDEGIDVLEEGHELTSEEITEIYASHGRRAIQQYSTVSITTGGMEQKEPQDLNDIQSWLGDINPNFDAFDPDSPYCNNCGSCALAVYKRLEGDTESVASAENIGYNEEMEALTGMEQVSMSPEEIERSLLTQGDGAHAIIGIDRAEGAGHWFNAANIGGRIVAIDGQTGEIRDWPPDYGDVVNWEMSVKKM